MRKMSNRICECVCLAFLALSCQVVASVPTKEECDAVRAKVEELTSDDYADFKAKKLAEVKLGEKLMEYVANEERPAARFLLAQDAYRHFVLGKDFEKAAEVYQLVLEEDGSECAVAIASPMKLKLSSFATSKHPAAKTLKDRIAEDEKGLRRIQTLKAKLKKTPGDEKISRELGIEYAIVCSWDVALAAFATCSGELKKIAEWELLEIKNEDYAADKVAKFWWAFADEFPRRKEAERAFKAHAAGWYRIALEEGAYTGNDVAVIEKRIASVEEDSDVPIGFVGGLKMPANGADLIIIKGSADGGDEWQYSTQEPEMGMEKWLSPHLPKWNAKSGSTGFDAGGYGSKPMDFVKRTDWDMARSKLWLRKEFTLASEPSRNVSVKIIATWDDKITIWMNGNQVCSSGLQFGRTVEFACDATHLHRGRNSISVVVENTRGPGHFDLCMKALSGTKVKGKIVRLLKDSKHNGERWQYSFTEPEMGMEKWVLSRFSKWNAQSGIMTRASWNGHPNKIWLRKEFDVDFEPRDAIRIDFFAAWDDCLHVWLNGKEFLRKVRCGSRMQTFPCDRKMLKKGKNVISILAENGAGNGFFDVGMEAEVKPGALKR